MITSMHTFTVFSGDGVCVFRGRNRYGHAQSLQNPVEPGSFVDEVESRSTPIRHFFNVEPFSFHLGGATPISTKEAFLVPLPPCGSR